MILNNNYCVKITYRIIIRHINFTVASARIANKTIPEVQKFSTRQKLSQLYVRDLYQLVLIFNVLHLQYYFISTMINCHFL